MYRKYRKTQRILRIGLALMLATSPLVGAELTWTGAGGVFFDDPNNWSNMMSPTSVDNLTFDGSASAFALNISGTQAARGMNFSGGSYTMGGGSGSSLSNDDTIVDGGTITATGTNTDWSMDNMTVGNTGAGTLNVENATDVSHTGLFIGQDGLSNGTVNVTGANTMFGGTSGSSIGRIGVNGTGTMNVSGGARSDVSSALIGEFAGSTGTVTVTGTSSQFVANSFDLRAGEAGTGTLNITAGALADATGSGNVIAGNLAGSVGAIYLNNGTLNSAQRIYVGEAGQGSFTAENGSTINSNLQFVVGQSVGGSGTATLDGVGTTLNISNSAHDLVVGWHGHGQMFIDNGASATAADDVMIGFGAGNTLDNRLEVTNGSSLTFGNSSDDEARVGANGTGTLVVSGGSSVTGHSLVAGETDGVTGTATIDGAGTTATLQSFTVGSQGTGTATVSGGAQVVVDTSTSTVADIFVGRSGNGNGTLNVMGDDGLPTPTPSTLSSNNRIEVGASTTTTGGTGTVNITAGGQLDTEGGVIGWHGGDGTVNVMGSGSRWDSSGDTLWLGHSGPGDLDISLGGTVDLSTLRMATLTNNPTAESKLTIDGAGSSLTVAGLSQFGEGRAAQVDVKNNATLTTGTDTTSNAEIGVNSSSDGATVTVNGGTWTHQGGRIRVGVHGGSATDPSKLSVINGGTVTANDSLVMADETGSHGLVEIGTNSSVSATWSVVGDRGPGSLDVTGGGSLSLSSTLDIGGSSTGTALISGSGSSVTTPSQMAVGRSNGSNGTLTIENGGTVSSAQVQIGELAGSTGTVNLDTGGTLLLSSGSMLTVGGNNGVAAGDGTLNVQGGTVNVLDTIAVTANGVVNLSSGKLQTSLLTRAPGSDFTFTGGTMSFHGNHVFDESELTKVFNDDKTLKSGMTLEATGDVALSAPLRLNSGTLRVGSITDVSMLDWDAGVFHLTADDLVIGTGGLFGESLVLGDDHDLIVDQATTNDGTIVAYSSGLVFHGGLTNNASLVLGDSHVSGTVNTPAGSTVTAFGSVTFQDMVSGAGNFYGPGEVSFLGGYSPGDSPAVVTFEGNLALDDMNTLFVEIGGNDNTMTAQYDQLLVDGTAIIDGTLDVSLLDLGGGTYAPQQGDSFSILSASGGLSGTFSNLNLPSLAGGLDWQLNAAANTLFLDVIASVLSGDFDFDGDFDGQDVDALVAVVAGMTNDLAFDLTGDGNVDLGDLQEWLVVAGAANLPSGNPYLAGDANLDGFVDGQDFIAWNGNKFTSIAAWTAGDFNADGIVDGQDFIEWNGNKFASSDVTGSSFAVPEPSGMDIWLLAIGLLGLPLRRRV